MNRSQVMGYKCSNDQIQMSGYLIRLELFFTYL
jgi:hypothetical protein